MACSKYTLKNTGNKISLFTYQRCQDGIWQYEVPLSAGQSKNIWLVDDTYSTVSNTIKIVSSSQFPAPKPEIDEYWLDTDLSLEIRAGSLYFDYILKSNIAAPTDITIKFTSSLETFYGDNILIDGEVTIKEGEYEGKTTYFYEEQFIENLTGEQSLVVDGSTYADTTTTVEQIILDAIVVNNDSVLSVGDDLYLSYVIIRPTPSVTPSSTPTPTPGLTPTPQPSSTPTATPGLTPTPSITPSVTSSGLPQPTPSNTPTQTPIFVNFFVSKWTTYSSNQTVKLPISPTGNYYCSVDWGDGTEYTLDGYNESLIYHTYETAGTYVMRINGTFEGFNFNLYGDSSSFNFSEITRWGCLGFDNQGSYFVGCENLTLNNVEDTINLSGITNLSNMFNGCDSLTSIANVSSWNTSTVTNMSGMFSYTSFNGNISTWNVSNVTDMSYMFLGNYYFNQDIGNWNISSVVNFSGFMESNTSFTLLPTYLSNIYNNWLLYGTPNTDITISFGQSQYTIPGQTGRDTLTNIFNWNITDGGPNFSPTPTNTPTPTITPTPSSTPLVPQPLSLTFDDILNADNLVGDSSNVSDWNTFFDLPTYGNEFTSVNVVGNVVNLFGGSNIETKFQLFSDNQHLLSVYDNSNSIVILGDETFGGASFNSVLQVAYFPSVTATTWTSISTQGVFGGCTYLTDIYLPQLNTFAGSEFYSCESMTGITLDFGNITSIGDYTFSDCYSLSGLSASSVFTAVTTIGQYSFSTSYFADFNFPVVTTVGEGAFYFAEPQVNTELSMPSLSATSSMSFLSSSFTSLDLPSLVSAGPDSFSGLYNLLTINLPLLSSAGSGALQSCSKLQNFYLPSLVTVGNSCFQLSSSATTFYLPSCTTLGDTTGNNNVFASITGENIDLTIQSSLLTCNGGSPDGDIVVLTGSNTVNITAIEPFISIWETSSPSESITLPLEPTGMYSFTVDWGDGGSDVITDWSQLEKTHTYSNASAYTITINGMIEGFNFLSEPTSKLNIKEILQWGFIQLGNNGNYFYDCTNLVLTGVTDNLNLTNTTNLSGTFLNCSQITTINNLNLWDVSNVTDISSMFYTTSINQDINNWDVSNVTNMSYVFGNCFYFNQELSGWTTSACTNMAGMLRNCFDFDKYIGNWDVSNVSDFSGMFFQCFNFNQELSGWTTSACTNMSNMFNGCSIFNKYIGNWDVSNVNSFEYMFNQCPNFNQELSGWTTSACTNMSNMFNGCSFFNKYIGNWDVSNVTTFGHTFKNCINFNQELSGWTTSACTNMYEMFANCTSFNKNINNWNVSNVANMYAMFAGCPNFNQELSGWTTSACTNMSNMFNGCSIFNKYIGNWDVSKVTSMQQMFSSCSNFNKELSGWTTSACTNMSYMFENCTNFNSDISNWDVSKISNFSEMFSNCTNYNQNLNNWNVSSATTFSGMFNACTNFDQELSGWTTSACTNMVGMFKDCFNFNRDISNWDVSKVTSMSNMFYQAVVFNQDLSGWCVPLIPSLPTLFDYNTPSWTGGTSTRPQWGTCPP